MDYHLTFLEKRKKKSGVTRLIIFQEGQKNSKHPQNFSSIIQFKTLRSVFFVIYKIPYYLYDVILHYKVKKEKKEKNVISAHPGIGPGPLVPKSDKNSRLRCEVVRGSK